MGYGDENYTTQTRVTMMSNMVGIQMKSERRKVKNLVMFLGSKNFAIVHLYFLRISLSTLNPLRRECTSVKRRLLFKDMTRINI